MLSIGIISVAPAITALIVPAMRKLMSKETFGWLLAGLVGSLFVWMLTYLPSIAEFGTLELSIPWVPQLGLNLALYLDGLSLLFSLMILGIGVVVIIYAGYYFETIQDAQRFHIQLLAFMSAMLIVVLAGNILTLFIGWELTSVLSFLLIGFNRNSAEARRGALQALIITGGGGLALLVGLVLLGTAAGSMELAQILDNTTLRESPWYGAFTLLILLGCFTKSAQWPFHFWLPGAMSAPTPASAYLHSATMVKAGIYVLLRLYPVLGDTALWQNTLLIIGLATMLSGAFLALRQRDLKAALAYSTISQLGIFVALVSLPHGAGLEAALVGILAHGLYKAALFLVVGAVDHITGTRSLDKLGGLAQVMPGWALVAALAGLSMAGLPPLLGFVAKESLLHAMLENPAALLVIVVNAALTVAMAFTLIWDVFWGKPFSRHHLHESPRGLLLGPTVLAGGSLLGGLALPALVTPLVSLSLHENAHLVLFSGLNTPFLLSVFAIGAGTVIFVTRASWRQRIMIPLLPTGAQIYQRALQKVEHTGDLVLKTQGGNLRHYLVVILGSVILLQTTAGLAHILGSPLTFEFNGSIDILRTALLVLALGMVLASIVFKNHLLAALTLGVTGYSVGGLFLIEPAPDVALVQFMVETLGSVLLIIMLARIHPRQRQRAMVSLWRQSRLSLFRDVTISLFIGAGVALFALAALSNRPKAASIATWYLHHTETTVGFPDVVGAIITDFRGMDTIIEITVFSVAALGVLTLLAKPSPGSRWPKHIPTTLRGLRWSVVGRTVKPDTTAVVPQVEVTVDEPDGQKATLVSSFSTPMTRIIARIVLPFAFLIALSQLLYGGDEPGDGFTAGVISGLGITLYYIVYGYYGARDRLRWLPARLLIGIGLTLVIANAAFPLLLGRPFLTHVAFEIPLPAQLHLSSTLIYETGIFLTVLGSATTTIEAITYPKEAEPL